MKHIRTLVAIAALAPALTFAAALKPGEYSVGGIQQICIVAGGTWYGTTFPSWGGGWIYDATTNSNTVFGNYAGGAGNDEMYIKRGKANWTEWRDDMSFSTYLTGQVMTKLSASCSPPAATKAGSGNPAR